MMTDHGSLKRAMTLMGDRVADHKLGIARIIADDHLGGSYSKQDSAALQLAPVVGIPATADQTKAMSDAAPVR